jgi:endonuclease YncB( thermonuclease family)
MSFGKVVTLSMLAAFSATAGVSYLADEPRDTVSVEVLSPSVQLVSTAARPASGYKQYTLCSGPTRHHCVVDGDTIWHNGTKIRIADIDTPEVSEPKCSSEAALGAKATKRLLQLVNAGPFEMQAWEGRDEDKYGRKLRVFVRDGRSLGDILVSEGLARTWTGRRQPWC